MPDHFYVYPAYLIRGVSRSLGRRVPGGDALAEVTAEMIARAARTLGYTADIEEAKHYPRRAHAFEGRVRIRKHSGVSKARFLKELARVLQHLPPPEKT